MITLSRHVATISHSPESVYRLWADPNKWMTWDADVADVQFVEEMAVGATGWVRPTSGPTTTFEVTALHRGRLLTSASRLPGARLMFEHVVEPVAAGSEVAVTISVDGFLSPLWHLVLRKSFSGAAARNVEGLAVRLDNA